MKRITRELLAAGQVYLSMPTKSVVEIDNVGTGSVLSTVHNVRKSKYRDTIGIAAFISLSLIWKHKLLPTSINHKGAEFELSMITPDNIYYCNSEEGDDNANVVCMDLDEVILSDNIHANSSLLSDYEGCKYTWIAEHCSKGLSEMFNQEGE